MSGTLFCRLCVNICKDYRNLYDEYGRDNETYEITVNYFDPMLLDVERGNHLTVVCFECWRHIIEFHNFRQYVLQAQTKLRDQQVAFVASNAKSPPRKANDSAASEILYQDIAVKVEAELVAPTEVETIHPIYNPSEEYNTLGTSGLFYGYIVKEEVEFISPSDVEGTTTGESKERATGERVNNIFLTDEQELSSLAKSTPTKIFPKCVTKTEPMWENLEKKPPVNTYIINKEVSTDKTSDSGASCSDDDDDDDGNVSSSDETYKQSQSEDEEDPVSTIIGNVIKDDDELMDISESELESLDVYGNSGCDDDDIYLPNYASSKLRRMSTIVKSENEYRSTVTGSPHKSTVTERISTINVNASHQNAPKKLMIKKMPEEQLDEHSIREPIIKMPTKRPIKSKREEELDDVIAQWRPNLECMICSESYTSYTLLQQHFREKHPNEEFYVSCCELKIKKRGHLAEHIRLHIDHKAFKCAFCDKRCTRKRNLRLHMSKMHGITDNGIICQPEQTTLSKNQTITRRKLKDSDEFIAQWLPSLECVVCKISCTSFTQLQDHFRQEHTDKECYIICCECKLSQRSLVAEHLRQHTHPRAFKCELCDGYFTMKRTLDYHMRTEHETATVDKCGISEKEDEKASLVELIEMNKLNCERNDGKPSKTQIPKEIALKESDELISQWLPALECGLCKKSCSSFTLLQQHFDQMHPDGDGYVLCCQRKFCKRYKLLDHSRNHLYSKAFKCELCGKRYSRRQGLQLHISKQHHISKYSVGGHVDHDNGSVSSNDIQDHYIAKTELLNTSNKRKSIKELDEIIAQWRPNLECMVCSETCTTYTLLQDHFRQQHPNRECYISCCRCKFAGRYDIEEHIRFHNDPNAFKCQYCGKCFSRRRALNGHLRTHSST